MGSKMGRVFWIVAACLLFGWCFSRMQIAADNCKKIKEPLSVSEVNSKNLKDGAYVEVAYECIFYGCYHGGIPYGKIRDYQALKLFGRDEYIFVSAFMEEDGFYKGKPYYFRSLKETDDFQPSDKYTFLGQVKKLDTDTREGLVGVVTRARVEEPLPMTLLNTNMAVEVELVDPKKLEDKKSTWQSFTIAAGVIVLFMIYRLIADFRAVSFLRKKERKEREENRAIEQKVRYTSKIEDDDSWKN